MVLLRAYARLHRRCLDGSIYRLISTIESEGCDKNSNIVSTIRNGRPWSRVCPLSASGLRGGTSKTLLPSMCTYTHDVYQNEKIVQDINEEMNEFFGSTFEKTNETKEQKREEEREVPGNLHHLQSLDVLQDAAMDSQQARSESKRSHVLKTIPQNTSRSEYGKLTHVDKQGTVSMVDVSSKPQDAMRTAKAKASILVGKDVFEALQENQNVEKGDVVAVSKLAGIMGAKQTSTLIPLCHPLMLTNIQVAIDFVPEHHSVDVTATASAVGPTGVEMEAMTAVSIAALTVYDMCKAMSKGIVIQNVCLVEKSGGKSGHWKRLES